MADIVFNDQQEAAIAASVDWFRGWRNKLHSKQIFFLAGYAGTGKTSVAQSIANLCGGERRVVFIAPTGKAASRLRQKGCKFAKTLHQFVYNMRGEDAEGEPIFVAKGSIDEQPLLIVLDEAVMVGGYDLRTLQAHNIPILALGDTGQVPPVKAVQVFMKGGEDFLLDKIERQGADSNIVRLSMFVRDGKRPPLREYEDVRVRSGRVTDKDLLEHVQDDGVILCSYNTTRTETNFRIRKLLGFEGALPQRGEKLVCMFNQHDAGFMNGEQIVVEDITEIPAGEYDDDGDDAHLLRLRGRSLTSGKMVTVAFNPLSFSSDADQRKEALKAVGGFDFGWVLTIHKSQGSEWEKVLVIEEILRGVSYAQMMYTAITRAILRLTIYRAA